MPVKKDKTTNKSATKAQEKATEQVAVEHVASDNAPKAKNQGETTKVKAKKEAKEVKTQAKKEVKEAKAEIKKAVKQAKAEVKKEVKTKPIKEAKPKAKKAEVKEEKPIEEKVEVEVEQKPQAESVAPEVKIIPKRKILFVASEATPFIATGGLAEVIGSLSKNLALNVENDVRVVIPLYQGIKYEYRERMTFMGNINVPLAWRNQYCGIFKYEENGVIFYFIDNEYYFKRPDCYGYYDDGERFAFFSRAVLEIMPFLNFYPEIMHCHDWQAALSAVYLKTIYCFRPEYQFIRSLFTIHNIEYQGKYSTDVLEDLFGISDSWRYLLEYDGCINLMKAAIECSEKFSTVSPRYAEEIKDPYYAHGLDPIIRRNAFKLFGILNGIDVTSYNPATDKAIFANYDSQDVAPKAKCKEELQKMVNLPVRADVPVIAVISRLVAHKGLDLVKAVMEDILREDVQVVILGKGDWAYENYFAELAKRYNGKLVTIIAFRPELSRQIYSGADLFLMPSKSEPCGLSQMIASRYGTVPIVRETGGLYDSIKPVGNGGNGFTFASYNAYDMLYVIREGLNCYRNKEFWKELVNRVMNVDFSWQKSAKDYENVYREMLK